MGERFGLIYKAKGMPSQAKQLAALETFGIGEGELWHDTADHSTLEQWFLSGRVCREGDTLVVATLNALGDTGRKQKAVRRKLEGMGITVEVAETDEGPKRERGRPPKYVLPDDLDAEFRLLWKNRNVLRPAFLAHVEKRLRERGIGPMPEISFFKRRYGARGRK